MNLFICSRFCTGSVQLLYMFATDIITRQMELALLKACAVLQTETHRDCVLYVLIHKSTASRTALSYDGDKLL